MTDAVHGPCSASAIPALTIVEWSMADAGAAFASANMGHRPLRLTGGCSIGMDDGWVMQLHYSI